MCPYFVVWRWDTAESCGRQFRRGWFVRSTEAVSRGKGSLKVMFCCRAREEPEELVLGELVQIGTYSSNRCGLSGLNF